MMSAAFVSSARRRKSGSIIGAVLCVGTTFAEVGVQPALIFAGVYLVYQQVENQVLQPVVQRRTLQMNPLIIMLALLAGTGVAGILGTLLALPIAGAIQVLLQDALEKRREHFDGDQADEEPGDKRTPASSGA
jgi:predicted PurR-regulated permease PerM